MSLYGNSVTVISKQPALSINVIESVSLAEKLSGDVFENKISVNVNETISNQVRIAWQETLSTEISLFVGGSNNLVTTTNLFDLSVDVYQSNYFGSSLDVQYGNLSINVGDNAQGTVNNSTGSVSGSNVVLSNIIFPLYSSEYNFEVSKDFQIGVGSVEIQSLPILNTSPPYNVNNYIQRDYGQRGVRSKEVQVIVYDYNPNYMIIDKTSITGNKEDEVFVDITRETDPRLIDAKVNNFIIGVTGESAEGSGQPAATSLESWF